MPRLIPPGTPSKTNRYLYPAGRGRLLAISLGAALALAAMLTYASASRFKTVASPGPLASPHVRFEEKCGACHSPSVADVRCESCHDPFGTGRYQNAGHVWFGTSDKTKIAHAAWLDCTRCHTDHRGRSFSIGRSDDRFCRSCHFSSMTSHPEFALVKAGVKKDEGLVFSHKGHLKAVRKANLEECQYCHEPTADRSGFEPPNFDRHCAKCHLTNGTLGSTDPIPAAAVILPQDVNAPWARTRKKAEPDRNGKVVVENLVHKDPWVLANIWKIAREVDPSGFAARRAVLETRAAELSQELAQVAARASPRENPESKRLRLRKRLLSLNADAPAREARGLQRELARIGIETELGSLPTVALRPRGRRELDAELSQLRAQLAFFDLASTARLSLTAEQRQSRLAAVAPLTAACTLCHVYDGALPQPVNAGIPALTRATYVHRPHVQQLGCAACHTRIEESKKAEDVNLPGVANCQSCHRPSRSRSDCAECHRYHPSKDPWPPI